MIIPTWQEAMDHKTEAKGFKDKKTGALKTYEPNKWRCIHAYRFYSGAGINEGSKPFQQRLRAASNLKGKLFGATLHNLGTDEDEIFDYFTSAMTDTQRITFKDTRFQSMLDFWKESFDDYLYEVGEDTSKLTDFQLCMPFFQVVANTVPGLLAEADAIEQLIAIFSDKADMHVRVGTPEEEAEDIDAVIEYKGKAWHKVSVKTGRSFSRKWVIDKYRKEFGKQKPTVYMDNLGNRVFIKGEDEIWDAKLSDEVKPYWSADSSETA